MRYQGQKLKLLYLKEILERKTDETHCLTASQMVEQLAQKGVRAERKSVYDDLEALEVYGLDIASEGRNTGYHLLSRDFELAEVKLMVDAIQSSKFLTEQKSYELIKKLECLCSEYEARNLQHQVYMTNRIKTENNSIHYNVDNIQRAIEADKKIGFKMFGYTREKEIVERRYGYMYRVSPYALIYEDDNYYLLGYDDKHRMIQHYRVDRMKGVSILEMERDGKEAFAKLDMAQYEKYTFSMYGSSGGKLTPVTMEFYNMMANVVMDKFGHDVSMIPQGNWRFRITVPVSVSPQFYAWVFGLGKCVEIIEPVNVREGMKRMLEKVAQKYQEGGAPETPRNLSNFRKKLRKRQKELKL